MKIEKLTATLHEMEIRLPETNEVLDLRQFVFCEVESDEGIKGFGITGSVMPWAIQTALQHHIFPEIKGMDPRNTEAIHTALRRKLNKRGFTGVFSYALSALDIALWDMRGKKEGRTIAELMGGHRDYASTYVTFGYPFFDYEQLAEYAKMFVGQGCDALKMVVARDKGGWKEDVRRIRVVREAIGEDVDLMIDANCLFAPADAKRFAHAIADVNLAFFEEPLPVNDARLLADFRRHTNIPIAAGQNEGHRWRHRDFLLNESVDYLQPNCCFNGGYTETLKIGHTAQSFNVSLANGGGWPTFNMHTMAGLANGGRTEFHYGMWQAGKRFFVGAPDPDFKTNTVKIPDRPGLGFVPDYDQLRDTLLSDPTKTRLAGTTGREGGMD